MQVDLVIDELSCVLLDNGNESNDDIPRMVLYLAGLLCQLDSLLTSSQLPLAVPVRAQALGFRTIFKQAYTAMMNLWRSGQVHQAAWDREVGRLREVLTAQLMATSYSTANIEEHVAGMLATMLSGGKNGQAGRGTVNLFLFHDGAMRVWEEALGARAADQPASLGQLSSLPSEARKRGWCWPMQPP